MGEMIWGGQTAVPVAVPVDGIWLFILGIILGATAIIARRNKMARLASFSLILLVPVVAVFAVNLPHTFTNGSIADADEVNANFEALANSTNAGEYRFTTSTNRITTFALIELDIVRIKELCADANGCEVKLCRRAGSSDSAQCNTALFSMDEVGSGYRKNTALFQDGNSMATNILWYVGDGFVSPVCSLTDGDALTGADTPFDNEVGLSLWVEPSTGDCSIVIKD